MKKSKIANMAVQLLGLYGIYTSYLVGLSLLSVGMQEGFYKLDITRLVIGLTPVILIMAFSVMVFTKPNKLSSIIFKPFNLCNDYNDQENKWLVDIHLILLVISGAYMVFNSLFTISNYGWTIYELSRDASMRSYNQMYISIVVGNVIGLLAGVYLMRNPRKFMPIDEEEI